MSKMKLGRGLEAIMSPLTANQNNDAAEKIENISIDKIKPNRHQPRTIFNEEKLQEVIKDMQEKYPEIIDLDLQAIKQEDKQIK